MQGWAVVENPSDEDWKDVRMSLVSGRPISFQMDLYQPLYVPRPVVEPELFASLRPPTYSGDMNEPRSGMRPGRGGRGPQRAEDKAEKEEVTDGIFKKRQEELYAPDKAPPTLKADAKSIG